jgi:hypothetical protein
MNGRMFLSEPAAETIFACARERAAGKPCIAPAPASTRRP